MIRVLQMPLLVAVSLSLVGCAGGGMFGPRGNVPVNVLGQSSRTSALPATTATQQTSAQVNQVAQVDPSPAFTSTTILKFIDPQAAAQLSEQEKTQAANAQFFALQFARPGVPRRWQGDKGAAGTVTTGPFVTVNDLNCRDFTHAVTVSGASYQTKGTACREGEALWEVVNLSTG